MTGQFVKLHRCLPSEAEVRSWENSLAAVAAAFRPLQRRDIGIAVGATGPIRDASIARDAPTPAARVALEYHLPLTGKRVDVMIVGRSSARESRVIQ
jgi:hypothetical protein